MDGANDCVYLDLMVSLCIITLDLYLSKHGGKKNLK